MPVAKTHAIAAAAILGLAVPQPASAIQATKPATAPATAPSSTMPAGALAVEATVTSVKGIVQIRTSENAAWQAAKPGMKLDQGAEIRTGLRSAIQFTVGPDEVITLDRLGTVTVLQAFQNQGRAKTDIGMKYGRTRYDIRDTNLQHESTIRSPGSTLALRGTDIIYEDQAPWVPQAVSVNGRAEFRNYKRQFVAFGGKKRASVAADKNSPAQQALTNTKSDPKGSFAGRTEAEDERNLTVQSIGGADADVQKAVQEALRGFTAGPNTSAVAVANGRGPLEFTLEWTSIASTFAPTNLDLIITDPRGQVVSPANPIIGDGITIGQHQGDDVGTSGIGGERVAWGEFFPNGRYTVQAVHQGGDDAQINLTSFLGEGEGLVETPINGGSDSPIVLSAGETFSGQFTPGRTRTRNRQASLRAERRQQASQAAPAKSARR